MEEEQMFLKTLQHQVSSLKSVNEHLQDHKEHLMNTLKKNLVSQQKDSDPEEFQRRLPEREAHVIQQLTDENIKLKADLDRMERDALKKELETKNQEVQEKEQRNYENLGKKTDELRGFMSYIDFMSGDGEPLADREERDLRERRESQTQRDEPPEAGPSQQQQQQQQRSPEQRQLRLKTTPVSAAPGTSSVSKRAREQEDAAAVVADPETTQEDPSRAPVSKKVGIIQTEDPEEEMFAEDREAEGVVPTVAVFSMEEYPGQNKGKKSTTSSYTPSHPQRFRGGMRRNKLKKKRRRMREVEVATRLWKENS